MHQGKYVEKLLQRFDKPVSTLVETVFRFSVDDSNYAFDTSLYRKLWDVLYMQAIQGWIYSTQFPN